MSNNEFICLSNNTYIFENVFMFLLSRHELCNKIQLISIQLQIDHVFLFLFYRFNYADRRIFFIPSHCINLIVEPKES